MEDRITELELRFMHQEKTIQELDDTVCRQDEIIIRLERELSLLREQYLLIAPSLAREPEDEEPPPHY